MRTGENPFKSAKSIEPPARITVGVLCNIPYQTGYFEGVFDALKLCLASIRAYADQPFDLLVVDNASCNEVKDYLIEEHQASHIDYLILNKRNIGRPNGVRQILRAAPGELVFYSDGDIYFKPDWMKAHLNIIQTFPDVGIVGGMPSKPVADYHTAPTFKWIEDFSHQLIVERGALIPDEWTEELLQSLGYADAEKKLAEWKKIMDCRITYRNVTAFVGAGHMQFLIARATIEKLPHQRFDQATGLNNLILDQVLEDAALLRLSTPRPYVYHTGNTLVGWLTDEYKRLVNPDFQAHKLSQSRPGLWKYPKIRQLLFYLHKWTFDKLFLTDVQPYR